MSSKAGKMEKEILAKQTKEAEQNTKDVDVRFDVELYGDEGKVSKSAYLKITGVPEDLPAELEDTIVKYGQSAFANMLNSRAYQEFYSLGKTVADEDPIFYNLNKLSHVKIINVKIIDVTKIN